MSLGRLQILSLGRILNIKRTSLTLTMAHKFSRKLEMGQRLRVFVDMDMVMCGFEQHILEEFRRKHPDSPFIPLEERRTFYVRDQYAKLGADLPDKMRDIYNSEGFFRNLPEIPGACEAVKEMSGMEGVDVFFCTSPLISYDFCLKEKYEWIEKHLGLEWCDKIIIAKDKTVMNAHILIDDRPNITGAVSRPLWEHVVFTACHNVHTDIKGKRRLNNWTDGSWRDLIKYFQKRI